MANICQNESGPGRGSLRGAGGKGYGKGIETELAIQIAARSGVQFIEPGNGAENPGGIYGSAQRLEFPRERCVPQGWFLHF